jgi:hypothetical protein
MTGRLLALIVVAGVCCSACGNGGADVPRSVAGAFEDALGSGDGAAACRLLAPTTLTQLEQSAGLPCNRAILDQDLPAAKGAEGAVAYGSMAQVRFARDTVFLAEFDAGWRVLAAGCTPADSRFDCTLQGG